MITALITGACGFCARHLAHRLHKEGNIHVLGMDLYKEPPSDRVLLDEYMQADLCNKEQVAGLIKRTKPDLAFNLAGLTNATAENVYQTNMLGVVYLLESLRLYAPEARILLVGSAAEYGKVSESYLPVTEDTPCKPFGAYGISKHAMTLVGLDYAGRYRMKVVIARPFNIVGPGISPELLVGALLNRAKNTLSKDKEPIVKVGNLDTERDFIAVDDVVEAYLKIVKGEHWGEVFNICSGRHYSVRSVIDVLLSQSPRKVKVEVDPELVRPLDVKISYGSWEKATRAFGFKPTISLEESLRAAWRYEMEGVF